MTTSFLGIPVDGEIVQSDRKPQRPLEEFSPILQAVLDDPTIVEFGWRQYTPYFNDGDPCVFGAYGVWVRTDADEQDADQYDLEVDYHHPTLGRRPRAYNSGTREYEDEPYEGPDEARHDRCRALHEAVESGEFHDVLLEAFGDHAEVTVRREGIRVEFYSHD
ncbi:hypothetical protein [Actinomadura nitritigenes]|uniref:hypothetical protein n=1 Tax=Actinomadura nitritigenes TaxID=134602 RepID=UPI003D8A2568